MIPLPLNIPWRLVAVAVAVLAILSAGIWFRGVLADRAAFAAQIESQAAELAEVNAEVERMNRQDAADRALEEQAEQRRVELAAKLDANIRELKKARGQLNEALSNCFDMVLPPEYLERLP